MTAVLAAVGVIGTGLLVAFAGARWLLNRSPLVGHTVIDYPEEHTGMDERGAVRSVQAAVISLPAEQVDEIWTPMHLERLARTYWRFLTRWTLGLVRVLYEEDERRVVFLARPFTLLRFRAPEYEMDDRHGVVRWYISDGVLVSRAGRGNGCLEIDVHREPGDERSVARLRVAVEVANFYPALASGIAYWFYANTQSRIHVIVTHGFLRSLARLDLAESRAGRYAEAAGP